MKRTVPKPTTLPFNAEQQEVRLILSPDATAEEQLQVINHYLPRTRNLAANLTMLRHLGISENDIAEILNGGSRYVYGEINSLKYSTVKMVCTCAKVSIEKKDNEYEVCLAGKPVEDYIRDERKRQEDLEKEITEHSKEDLVREVRALRREVKHLSESLKMKERENDTLLKLCEIVEK